MNTIEAIKAIKPGPLFDKALISFVNSGRSLVKISIFGVAPKVSESPALSANFFFDENDIT